MHALLTGSITRYICLGVSVWSWAWLSACSTSQPVQPIQPTPTQLTPETRSELRVDDLITGAQTLMSPEREQHLVKAIALAIDQDLLTEASVIYQQIQPTRFTQDINLSFEYQKVSGRLFLALERYDSAEKHLDAAQRILNGSRELTRSQEMAFYALREALLRAQGQFFKIAKLRINRLKNSLSDQTTPEHEVINIHETIWSQLKQTSQIEIEQTLLSLDPRTQPELAAWLDLAFLMRTADTNIKNQLKLLQDWKHRWSYTLVAKNPPSDIQRLLDAKLNAYRQIGILLPTSGPLKQASAAVLKGILTGYYANLTSELEQAQLDLNAPKLRVYDTSDADVAITQIYAQAVADGCDFIIGPLVKARVEALAQHSDIRVPTLALNYTNTSKDTDKHLSRSHLLQFGLSIEDETRQIAGVSERLDYRRALILFPETEWGFRLAKAFGNDWKEAGGDIVAKQTYTQTKFFSDEIQDALEITQSKARQRQLRQLLGERLEFQPRRRKDIDMVFLAATPEDARQIKPTLNFHYAQQIPVFSTSHVYSGAEDAKRNTDLDDIYFLDIPWVLTNESQLKDKFKLAWPNSSNQYIRLHAFGIDAYHIMLYHGLIAELAEISLPGTTGMLHLNAARKVQRELTWAQFHRGRAKLITLERGAQ